MRLYHATLKSNLDSIRRHGLNPEYSRGKEKVVWLHTQSRRAWAIVHIHARQNVNLADIIIIEVNVPYTKLRRRRRGLWTTDTPITTIGDITDAETDAAGGNNR